MSTPLVTITLDTEIGGRRYDQYGDPTQPDTIADSIVNQAVDLLVEKVREDVAQAVIAKADEQITAQVRELVASVLTEPYQVTDQFGAASKPTTIHERIAEKVKAELAPAHLLSGGRHGCAEFLGAVRDQAAALIANAVKDGLK